MDFLERIFNPHVHFKLLVCEKLELSKQFHEDLEQNAQEFHQKHVTPLA